MPIVVPKAARVLFADWIWRGVIPDTFPLEIGLFKNNITPTPDTVFADLVEATFTGYSNYPFTRADNPASFLAGTAGRVLLANDSFIRTCTGAPHNIYGWYCNAPTLGVLLLVERYADPHVLQIGSTHTLIPNVDLGKLVTD